MGGVCVVGKETHSNRSEAVLVGTSIKCSFLLMKGNSKRSLPFSEQLGLAHNIILCWPVAGADWGSECKDLTLSVHILLFSSRIKIDVVPFTAQSSVASLRSVNSVTQFSS